MSTTGEFEGVIVVCTGNICRSPMAVGLLRAAVKACGQGPKVESAGLAALVGEPPDSIATRLMAERGIDIGDHSARQATEPLLRRYALVLTTARAQREFVEKTWPVFRGRVYRWGEWQDFDVPDPYGKGEAAFRVALAALDRGLADWTTRLGIRTA